jgi:hypothetical protein
MHKEEETCLVGDVLVEIELKDGIKAESSVEKRTEYLEDKEHHPSK